MVTILLHWADSSQQNRNIKDAFIVVAALMHKMGLCCSTEQCRHIPVITPSMHVHVGDGEI